MLLDHRRRKATRARYSQANTSPHWRDFRDSAETRMNQGSFDCHNFRFRQCGDEGARLFFNPTHLRGAA
jgi:hypothetical protein